MGRGKGGRSSGSRTNNFDINYDFEIYTLQPDGQTPTSFEGAIENFNGRFRDTDSNEFALSDEIEVSGLTLGLTPRFLNENIQFTLFDGTPITASIDDGNIPFTDGVATTDVARIEYKIGNELSNENGDISEFVLFIEDEDEDISNGFQAGGIEIDVDRATNDIDYIVTEDLFTLITSVRVSGQDINDPNIIVSTENEARELMFETFPPVAVNDSASTEINIAITIDVLANDNVGFIDSFDISSSQGGTVSLNDGGTVDNPIDDQLEYTPATDFLGIDSFEYTTTNGNKTSTAATVTIEVSEPVVEEPVIFPGNLNDLLDSLTGQDVVNPLDARSGDDTLIVDESNQDLFGGGGNDHFFVTSGGNNTITGGEGADQFWIATVGFPEAINTITDFIIGEDIIGVSGLGVGFADVTLTQQGDDALIAINSNDLALLQGIDITNLGESDFAFM